MKNKTLHLILKKKWFDLISSGEKTEEYRDINYLYCTRLLNYYDEEYGWRKMTKHKAYEYFFNGTLLDNIKTSLSHQQKGCYDGVIEYIEYDNVCFHLGYTNTTITFKINNIRIGVGKEEWGAETDKEYFIIDLGEKLI